MKRLILSILISLLSVNVGSMYAQTLPWEHGDLRVSADGQRFEHTDGTPFFWLADTGWLLPEKLNREEAKGYLECVKGAEFNVVQVQVLNGVPSINAYGQTSNPDGWNMGAIAGSAGYGYWQHLDYIVDEARQRGIYIAMVPIWGGLVKAGKMNEGEARIYGEFLAERYGQCPNIVWIIGGDVRGDVKPEVWEALATTIKAHDQRHLMTYHPFGRTSSAYWWHDRDWLDFNMFQSGHRRYDQTRGDGDSTAEAAIAEDNWRYVGDGLSRTPHKPIIDGEPSYEDIPQGLHDPTEPRWQAADVRRYAYWSVLAGAAGHTYGHNSVMQMLHPGEAGGYGADKPWYEGVKAPGYNQMKYVKRLMEEFSGPRVADQSLILSANGERYDRAIACRGEDFILVYTYTNQPLDIDLTKIPGRQKEAYWYNPKDGTKEPAGTLTGTHAKLHHGGEQVPGNDWVLVIVRS